MPVVIPLVDVAKASDLATLQTQVAAMQTAITALQSIITANSITLRDPSTGGHKYQYSPDSTGELNVDDLGV